MVTASGIQEGFFSKAHLVRLGSSTMLSPLFDTHCMAAGRLLRRCGCKGTAEMPTKQRQSLMTVMAQATSPSPRLWPPETCDEHQSLTMGMSDSSDSLAQKDTISTSGEKERAPWPVTLGTLLALQLGWGLWLMPAVYARSAYSLTLGALQ